MRASPDFHEGDIHLHQLAPHRAMEVLFEESGLEAPDGDQPLIKMSLGKRNKFFTRNLMQCFLLELHLELSKREPAESDYRTTHIHNGKLRLPMGAGKEGRNAPSRPECACGADGDEEGKGVEA